MILTLELLNSYLTYIFIFWRHRFQYLDRGEYPALKFEPDLTTYYQSTYLDFYYSHEFSLLDITVLSKISENSTYNNIPKIFKSFVFLMQALTSTPKIESFSIFYAAFDYIVKSIDSRPLQKNLNSVVIKTRSHIGILTYL